MEHLKIGKTRLEAFSDGVLAIIITIMVLELKAPAGDSFTSLLALLPVLLSYVLSFIYVGIYWNNHHHMLHTAKTITGAIMWANLHLLFWLSLTPFATAWMEQSQFAPIPTQFYGFVLFMAAMAYWILQNTIIAHQGRESLLKAAIGDDWKGKLSPVIYLAAIVISHWVPLAGIILYAVVALIWIVPDSRIAKLYLSGQ